MKLCIDAGNSSITQGLFDNGQLVKKSVLPTADYRKFRLTQKIDKVVYASVVPHIDSYFSRYFNKTDFLQITYKHIKTIRIALPKKTEIGIDRLVNVMGAAVFYKAPLIIVDLGTATTFCVLDKKMTYQGGLICPGINLTRLVLHQKTAKLPLIELKAKPAKLIGQSTVEAMQSGIYHGYIALINGLLDKLKLQIPAAKVIITGGYAELLAGDLNVDIVDTDLTLKSLNLF